jgi:transglutaminase-like putative cysteine protease
MIRTGSMSLAGVLPLLLSVLSAPSAFAADAPEWVRRAVATAPQYDPVANRAAHLLREETVSVDEGGKARIVRRGVVRILTPEGRSEAIAVVPYLQRSDDIKSFRAWVLRPSGATKALDDSDVLDMEVGTGLYSETRVRSIVATDQVEPGAVFAYEADLESRFVFRDFEWAFQDEYPAARSRFTIRAPQGWSVKSAVFNHVALTPTEDGPSRTWELRDLPGIPDEPRRPELSALVPRLAVSVIPPANGPGDVHGFARWDDLAAWMWKATDARANTSPRLVGLAKELTVPGGDREIEKVRSIARHVQSVRYVSIQLGMGRGGGYVPHDAVDVLTLGYGDCKDKANLMRALLREAGIPAYLLLVYSGDGAYVREEWPSAQQFNHCIVAVRVTDPKASPVIEHPKLGKLLIFDPTDAATTFGDLPVEEQGSLGLLVSTEPGNLIRLPVLPPDGNRSVRENELTINVDGSVHVVAREHSTGQPGAEERRLYQSLARPDYMERIETWIAGSIAGPSVSRIEPLDRPSEGVFDLTLEFSAPQYARAVAQGLVVFRPALLEPWDRVALTASERKLPILLRSRTFRETSTIRLPESYEIDEMPQAVRIDAPFGAYASSLERADSGRTIRMSREITIRGATIPASGYAEVRSFYERLRAAEQAMVVLVKK